MEANEVRSPVGRRSKDAYDNALGLREVETDVAETFEAEFPIVTRRTVKLIKSAGEGPGASTSSKTGPKYAGANSRLLGSPDRLDTVFVGPGFFDVRPATVPTVDHFVGRSIRPSVTN